MGIQNKFKGVLYDFKLSATSLLFWIKNIFFKNDLSTFFWSTLLYICGILLYWLSVLLGKLVVLFPLLPFSTFLSIWTSFVGMFLAFLVMLNINNQKTSTGRDFIDLISFELYNLKKDERMFILSPNINIGSYLFRGESIFDTAIKKALSKGAKIHFITLALDRDYLNKFEKTRPDKKLTFFKNGSLFKSPQLTFIYERYLHKMVNTNDNETPFLKRFSSKKTSRNPYEVAKTSHQELLEILNSQNAEFTFCDDRFKDKSWVGFFTNKKFFIASYQDVVPTEGKVIVKGEMIETPDVVKALNEYIIKEYRSFEMTR